MPDGWLDPNKYQHIPILSATGPGTMVDGYAWKWINHSTEGPAGSIDGVISLFQSKPTYAPHFCIDPMGTRRRVQFTPWIWSACALACGTDGWQTNRGRAVQVEICGYAKDSQDWPEDALWQVADLIADVIKDGCPINPNHTPDSSHLTGVLATIDAPQRFSWEQWRLFDGIAAHVYVPNNDHWDCGRLNNLRLGQMVRQILAGENVPIPAPGPPGPVPSGPGANCIVKGMTGGQVMLIQQLLNGLGYDTGGIDGIFGDRTEAAVKAFQASVGICVDGIVGPITQAKLSQAYAAAGKKPPLPTPSTNHPAWPGRYLSLQSPMLSGGDVRQWQAQMAARGWQISVDGVYGPASESICLQFQQQKGLTADGIVGPQTWDAAWTAPIT